MPPAPEEPKPKPRRHLYVGPDVGVFLPTSARTQRAFKSAWVDVGLGLGAIAHLKEGGRFAPDIHILSQVANGNRLFFGLVGIDYRHPFGVKFPHPADSNRDGAQSPMPIPNWVPYFGASADLMVGDLRDVSEGIHSAVRTGLSGSLFAGINFRDHAFMEARYREDTVVKSFDLSGFSFNVGYRFRF